ncbi:Proline--tRNA ligase [Golovinomyces cichoracearum]|uniref:proline--tRNA ligase n=1 Tax=Golovinomyces cichoracearum TaxID=62708 RepID=A0A420IS49_9PEZI|nr:Proline--tRNA ligase [Golovinomyces cichoracearum]
MLIQQNCFRRYCGGSLRQGGLTTKIILCHQSKLFPNYQLELYSTLPDTRARLSRIWIPTGGTAASIEEDSHAKLIRAGFFRQAYSGIYHMLPLGRRVQCKLEALIDKYMNQLGASKLSLSSISSEELWQRSGRLNKASSELFRFEDRRSTKFLLSPTHEEEITSLVSSTIKSYKELPLRVYQITRKYRDEPRPRHGLFRSREFVMKDLYTFDCSPSSALSTYEAVRAVYANLFNELKLPYIEAEADSGDMGGNLSHEYHFPTPKGEDHLITCSNCDYVVNEELAEILVSERPKSDMKLNDGQLTDIKTRILRGISKDRSTLINIWYEAESNADVLSSLAKVNFHAIKAICPEFDPSVEDASPYFSKNTDSSQRVSEENPKQIDQIINIADYRVPASVLQLIKEKSPQLEILPASLASDYNLVHIQNLFEHPSSSMPMNLLRRQDGDICPRCNKGSLKIFKAIELGHTFHLGNRYSKPLQAFVSMPLEIVQRESMVYEEDPDSQSNTNRRVPMQMGCHGIGVSRMIGAVADTLADEKGLNWPRVMAPYEVVILASKGLDAGAEHVYDHLNTEAAPLVDLVLDDRNLSFPWKMKDADLIGFPVIIVVGRRWVSEQICEVQCRRLKIRSEISLKDLGDFVNSLISQL